ncbi:MAG: hypothetical protein ACOX8U_05780 [Bradymonadia bacterium]
MSVDGANCGKCARQCPDGYHCADSDCVLNVKTCNGVELDLAQLNLADCERCMPKWGNCNGSWEDGCEVDLRKTALHCGECGQACESGQGCRNGSCTDVFSCDWPNRVCKVGEELHCIDVNNDVNNCGVCGLQCAQVDGVSAECENGNCVYQCEVGENCAPPGYEPVCIQTQTAEHCGGCAKRCSTALHNTESASCNAGICEISCKPMFGDCDENHENGCEQSLRFDQKHCGACNSDCKSPGVCIEGSCCVPNCSGKICGDDGCGGICGECALGKICNTSGTACEANIENVGCADKTREGYLDIGVYDKIAACGGAWTVPGIHHNEGPSCNRQAGNDGNNRMGEDCNVEDLCAEGWHVCLGRNDLRSRTTLGCGNIMQGVHAGTLAFFLTRTSSTGNHRCAPDTIGQPINNNDIFGCGNLGYELKLAGQEVIDLCDPLTRASHNVCYTLQTPEYSRDVWDCGDRNVSDDTINEAAIVVKKDPDKYGGVLCCMDHCKTDKDCPSGQYCAHKVCVECREDSHCPGTQTCKGFYCK